MQDDQINKSVDDLMGQDVGADSTSVQTTTPGLSLGSNPSLPEPPIGTPVPQLPSDDDADQDDSQSEPELDQPAETSDNDEVVVPEIEASEASSEPTESEDISSSTPTELDQIKQDALAQLSPIVNELDQPAEEKYRTLMMLIQASDDQTLIKSAYDAANRIDDKKVRAEALLAIVNEINYFAGQSDK